MGLFNSLFERKKNGEIKMDTPLPWIPLTSIDQLPEILEKSATRTQLIFKHSTTCGISRMVLKGFGKDFDFEAGSVDLYYLDLHEFRGVSNAVADTFRVPHQSPQLLIIKERVAAANASHGGIIDVDLNTYSSISK